MSLLNPAALWLLLAVPLVFLLPRLRVHARRRLVANAYLWIPDPSGRPRLVTELQRHWRLLLQAALVALVALAIARPILTTSGPTAALIIDVSASMAAKTAGGTRLDEARARARDVVAALPRGSRVRLIAAGDTPSDLGTFGARDMALRRAIERVSATAGSAHLADAISMARGMNGAIVHVITDQASGGTDEAIGWTTVGEPVENVAITALAVRRLPNSPFDAVCRVEVRNFGKTAREIPIEVRHDDRALVTETLHVEAGATAAIVRAVQGPAGVYRAGITVDDGLEGDDTRSERVRAARTAVELLGTPNEYLRTALDVNPFLEVGGTRGAPIVVCDDCAGASRAAGVLEVRRGDTAPPAPLRVTSPGHPVTADLSLDDVVAPVARAAIPADADVLARAGNDPAIVAYERDGRRIVSILVDLDRSNLTTATAFPVLVANAMDWISASADPPEDPGNVARAESDLRATPVRSVRQASVAGRSEEHDVELFAWLVAAALVLLAIEWRAEPHATPRWIAATAALLILAAFGARIPGGRADVSVMFALDRSDSVPLREQMNAVQRVTSLAAAKRDGDQAGVVVFGRDALVEHALSPRVPAAAVASSVTAEGTDIEGALRLARTALNARGPRRIVLFSDGRETTGNAVTEATAAHAGGIVVDVVPASARSIVPVHVTRVIAPPRVDVGEPFALEVELAGPPSGSANVRVDRDGRTIATLESRLDPAGAARLRIEDRIAAPGAATYTANIVHDEGDSSAEDGAVVIAQGAPSALVISPSGGVRAALAAGGTRVASGSPAQLPVTSASLASYDTVVLEDVAADDINARQASALADYVNGGGGLFISGDSSTLGPAGYPGTPLGEILPIDLRRRPGTRAPEVSLVVVFDKSGSMADRVGDVSKIELARRAVLSVVGVMPPSDRLGVIAFDTVPQSLAPLSSALDPAALRERLRATAPGGSTALAPAVEMARQWLAATPAGRRQILLISDGRSSDADLARVVELVRDRGTADLSIVAIGDDADRAFFTRLASASGGRVFFPDDVNRLPDVVAREAARATGGWRVDEPFAARFGGRHPVLSGITPGALPVLDGYVAAQLRPSAESILLSHLGDPVLSAWQVGLGRVAVFNAAQSSAFQRAEAAGMLWRQVVRWAGRGRESGLIDARLTRGASGADLVVEARTATGAFATDLTARAKVQTPSGKRETIELAQRTPGRYEGSCRTNEAGAYIASIALASAAGEETRVMRGFYWAGAQERAGAGADLARLSKIAAAGGGRVLSDSDDPFAGPRPLAYRDVSRWVAAAALLLFMAMLARRRGLTAAFVLERWRARHAPREIALT